MTNLEAWAIVWSGLGCRPGESIVERAECARYHGHARAAAAEVILALPDGASSDDRWAAMFRAAELLTGRAS